ncbi:MAG: DUF1569 domain-containing protein [Cytophagales bacterium]|nr:DUF1569 domain-containing protein [Cytophagales bacterium]
MNDIFTKEITSEIIKRIESLNSESSPVWGKMSVGQMLAHCCIVYEQVFDPKEPKPKGLRKIFLRWFVKKMVVGEKPYKQGLPTPAYFVIKEDKNFESEKKRLVDFISQVQELGGSHFDGKESHSFGALSKNEWNNMFYKHLDHHLKQFNV